ncbi:hypothetical protein GUJ93_ZPchr0004g39309 [Zizania palustris]|uniref:Uncharacterized protein n=1 Tax=Zizania palustris TaxID=103762 RepID=A0A8J5T0U4_ZIZPA|nr:hypothetical protein GUJ93_ZPchr0004g39309 [Zizania palustris]
MAMGDGVGSCSLAVTASEDYESWTEQQKLEDILNCDPSRNIMPKHPESKAYFEKELQERLDRYIYVASPKLAPAFQKDSVKHFYQVFNCWVALEGTSLCGYCSDPNALHRYGFSPLHLAA